VGGVGALWVVWWLWCLRGERAAAVDRPAASDEPGGDDEPALPFSHVFWLQTFWIALMVSFSVNIFWHFYRVWLPRLLERDMDLSPSGGVQYVLAGYYIAADLGSMGAGYLVRTLTYRGWSVERARKAVMLGTALLCLLSAVTAAAAGNPWVALPLIFVVAAGSLGGFPIMFALTQEISRRHTALCVGLIGALVWFIIAGMKPLEGWLADRMGTFRPMLIAVGFVPLVGALVGLLWPDRRPPADDGAFQAATTQTTTAAGQDG
jgi:ACS family hexuronate transporter-like MFS transporter